MDYRGGDLDLRTPGGRPAASAEVERADSSFGARDLNEASFGAAPMSAASGGGAPIFVDDTLMACCNHAYDVAVAHRSADVRIEHLLYALTRIDAAAEVLEAAGIRDAGLRREGATIIASEIPIGLTNGTAKPRRSAAFEEALRLAAQQGYRRNRPAGVADLIHVFTDIKPDLPGLDLLRRHMPPAYRESEDYGAMSFSAARYQPQDMPGYGSRPLLNDSRAVRYEPQEAVDSYQNVRLGELERMVRELRDELSAERHAMSGLLSELKRDVLSQRSAASGLTTSLQDRLTEMERTLLGAASSGDNGRAVREVMERTSERLSQIERGVFGQMEELSRRVGSLSEKIAQQEQRERPVSAEFERVSRELRQVTEKLTALEQSTGDGDLDIDIMPILSRLDGVERAVRERPSAPHVDLSPLLSRMEVVETVVRERPVNGAIDMSPVLSRLDIVETAVRERPADQGESLMAVNERLKNMERLIASQPRSEAGVDIAPLENRLADIERAILNDDGGVQSRRLEERLDGLERFVSRHFSEMSGLLANQTTPDTDLVTALQAEIKALAGTVATGNASQERLTSSLKNEINAIAGVATSGTAGTERVLAGLENRMREVAELGNRLGAMTQAQETAAANVNARLERLEQHIGRNEEVIATGRAEFVRELGDVHEAIMKLNSNQHAISQSVESWRNDTVGSVNGVTARLASFEQRYDGPGDEIQELSRNLDQMYRITVERYHRRNRFWFWLFGTDDWIGASWPSQTARVEQELRAMKRSAETAVQTTA